VSPPAKEVNLVDGDTLDLKCTSEDPSVRFEFQLTPDLPQERFQFEDPPFSVRFLMPNVNIHDEGMVTCIGRKSVPDPSFDFQHEWSYQVFRKYQLVLDFHTSMYTYFYSFSFCPIAEKKDAKSRSIVHYKAFSTKLDNWVCRSKSSRIPSVAFVRCSNPMECDVRSQCLRSVSTLPFSRLTLPDCFKSMPYLIAVIAVRSY